MLQSNDIDKSGKMSIEKSDSVGKFNELDKFACNTYSSGRRIMSNNN